VSAAKPSTVVVVYIAIAVMVIVLIAVAIVGQLDTLGCIRCVR
jgi:hypothetical protein